MIEVTDEMVERGRAAEYGDWTGNGGQTFQRAKVRKILEAALNPPPEPEIPVSDAMTRVGAQALAGWLRDREERAAMAREVYRAMEACRRKEEGAYIDGPKVNFRDHLHRRIGDTVRSHRRKDD